MARNILNFEMGGQQQVLKEQEKKVWKVSLKMINILSEIWEKSLLINDGIEPGLSLSSLLTNEIMFSQSAAERDFHKEKTYVHHLALHIDFWKEIEFFQSSASTSFVLKCYRWWVTHLKVITFAHPFAWQTLNSFHFFLSTPFIYIKLWRWQMWWIACKDMHSKPDDDSMMMRCPLNIVSI